MIENYEKSLDELKLNSKKQQDNIMNINSPFEKLNQIDVIECEKIQNEIQNIKRKIKSINNTGIRRM